MEISCVNKVIVWYHTCCFRHAEGGGLQCEMAAVLVGKFELNLKARPMGA